MDRLTWHFPGRGQREAPAYYLADGFELVAVRIRAEQAPIQVDFEVDILEEGVSIFADSDVAFQSMGTTPYHKDSTSTYVKLVKGDSIELDAENFRKDEIGPGWVTCVIGSDGGASNVTVQLDIEAPEEPDVSE